MNNSTDITANLFTFYDSLASHGKLGQGDIAGIPWVGNPSGGWPAYLLGGADPDPDTVKRIAAAMRDDRIPAFWIMESDPGSDTEKVLSAHGIRMINYWTGMCMDTSAVKGHQAAGSGQTLPVESASRPHSEGQWEIRKISVESEMDQWVALVNRVVMTSSQLDRDLFRKLLQYDAFYFYGLWQDDEILSTTLIFVHDQAGGLYFVATDPAHQGKGYGRAIAGHAMKEVEKAGAKRFVLHSTRQGLRLYRGMGFREVNRYDIYWLLGKR